MCWALRYASSGMACRYGAGVSFLIPGECEWLLAYPLVVPNTPLLKISAIAFAIFLSCASVLSVGLMSLLARLRHTSAPVRVSEMSTTSVPIRTGCALADPHWSPPRPKGPKPYADPVISSPCQNQLVTVRFSGSLGNTRLQDSNRLRFQPRRLSPIYGFSRRLQLVCGFQQRDLLLC